MWIVDMKSVNQLFPRQLPNHVRCAHVIGGYVWIVDMKSVNQLFPCQLPSHVRCAHVNWWLCVDCGYEVGEPVVSPPAT